MRDAFPSASNSVINTIINVWEPATDKFVKNCYGHATVRNFWNSQPCGIKMQKTWTLTDNSYWKTCRKIRMRQRGSHYLFVKNFIITYLPKAKVTVIIIFHGKKEGRKNVYTTHEHGRRSLIFWRAQRVRPFVMYRSISGTVKQTYKAPWGTDTQTVLRYKRGEGWRSYPDAVRCDFYDLK
jgi:hypothetical protein